MPSAQTQMCFKGRAEREDVQPACLWLRGEGSGVKPHLGGAVCGGHRDLVADVAWAVSMLDVLDVEARGADLHPVCSLGESWPVRMELAAVRTVRASETS